MRILITGVDQPLGALAASALRGEHELRLTGAQALAPAGFEDLEYVPADLREPEEVKPLLTGVHAVAHLAVHPRPETPDPAAEKLALDLAARGTYVLLQEAAAAGVRRLVLASRLDLLAAYPADYVVDESWKPLPDANAASLAPYLAELTVREFVRAEQLHGICLRLGDLGNAPEGTTADDAARVLTRALTMDLTGQRYRWLLYHICSTDRYALGAAGGAPLSFVRGGA